MILGRGVEFREFEKYLNRPYILKTREGRYIAIGWSHKYLSIIFELEKIIQHL